MPKSEILCLVHADIKRSNFEQRPEMQPAVETSNKNWKCISPKHNVRYTTISDKCCEDTKNPQQSHYKQSGTILKRQHHGAGMFYVQNAFHILLPIQKECSAIGLLHDDLKHVQIMLLEGQISRMDCMLLPVYGGLFLDKVLLAGLDLNTQGSFLNGLTPLRATVARFFFNFMLWTPPSLNLQFFFSSAMAKST